jgi:tripartite-type tricarboxylate transporter receptor subunit TctC
VIVQNMTGAGGLRAINYLYEKAAQDGTVLGMPVQENVLSDALGATEVRYKITDFNWIGRLAPGVDVIVTWWTSGVRSIADATRAPVPLGATGPASGTSLYPLMLNSLVGTKFNIIPGYKHNEMLLAIERGETYGAFTSLATLKTTYPTWIPNKRVNMLVAISPEPVAELAGVPDLLSLGRNSSDRQVLAIFASASTVGRSILTTPRVPAERVAALRDAFEGMTKDADFLAEIAKTHAEFGPLAGAALQKLIAQSRDVPPAVLQRARAAVRR